MRRDPMHIRRFLVDETGAATLEFVCCVPLLLLTIFQVVEVGIITTRTMLLERGVDVAVRDLRLGITPDMTHAKLKDLVCDGALALGGCRQNLILEVVEFDPAAAYPQNSPNCIDRTGTLNPTISFDAGDRGKLMFVRACVVIDVLFPTVGVGLALPKDSSGGFQLISYSAFMNEPA